MRTILQLLTAALALTLLAGCPHRDELPGPDATRTGAETTRQTEAEAMAQEETESNNDPALGDDAESEGTNSTSAAPNLTTTVFAVQGMTCEDCSKAIEAKLAAMEGVRTVAADSAAGITKVEYNPQAVNDAQIIAAIESLKFKASVKDDAAAPAGDKGRDPGKDEAKTV
jgi:copper chaperone CopZ/predicted small lipoprotein YifL